MTGLGGQGTVERGPDAGVHAMWAAAMGSVGKSSRVLPGKRLSRLQPGPHRRTDLPQVPENPHPRTL